MESAVRQRHGVAEISFKLQQVDRLIATVIETIFQTHIYQEPVSRVVPILASRSKGVDAKENPNCWWNTIGEWKRVGGVAR